MSYTLPHTKISRQSIHDLLSTVDIVPVVQTHVSIKKRGNNWHGLCPFHQEKTPSFTVNHVKQFFYCFGCHASGNAIDFIMSYERLLFPDAVIKLASDHGFNLEFESQSNPNETSIIPILHQIQKWFQAIHLNHPHHVHIHHQSIRAQ